jgi:hypothetical protein
MSSTPPTIMDVVKLANRIRQHLYRKDGLPDQTPILDGLASGLDTGLTLLELSVGDYRGLAPDAARGIVDYFLQEVDKHSLSNPQVAMWYVAFAEAVERLFIQDRDGTQT